MTTPILKIKVLPKSILKGKMDVRFPANVVTSNFLKLVRANGTFTFDVDYTQLGPGPISDPASAMIALLDATAGVYRVVSLSSLLTSGIDADIQAIAALTGTGILSRTADGAWALRTLTAPAAGITITNPAGIAGNPTLGLANDLAAVEGLAGNGMASRTAADTWAVRTITAGASIGVTNGDGVSGNPTIAVTDAELVALASLISAADQLPYFTGSGTASLATFTTFARTLVDDATQGAMQTTLGLVPGTNVQAFDSDLAALAANAGTGIWAITGSGTGSVRTITAPAAGITISNGGGVAGNPTLALANDLSALEGLGSTGIARRTATDTWTVGTAVANSELATMAAYTIKANATGSAAVPTDVSIPALTQKASPVAADKIMIADSAASDALKYVTVSSISSAGSVSSIAGNTGAFTLSTGITNSTNDIRLDRGQLPGETSTGSASAGNMGEYVSASRASASAINLTTGTDANVLASPLSLTAGDWDVSGVVGYSPSGSTVVTIIISGISTTSNSLPGADSGQQSGISYGTAGATGGSSTYNVIPTTRVSVSTTTSVYLVARASFTTSNLAVWGNIRARRVR